MIDFAKALGKTAIAKKTNPMEIYESLDRRSEIGPLRPSQTKVLDQWYKTKQEQRDIIIKLHTGEGKTVIGLLLLLSRINAGRGRCLYICPNKQLVAQTINEAQKFGIPHCTLTTSGDLPDDFLAGDKFLICHIQKLVNGKTIFGLDQRSIDIDTIILDDSHACIDAISSAFTLKLNCDHGFYIKCLTLFEDALLTQGAGTFAEIKNNQYTSFLQIPYWAWLDKQAQVLEYLYPYMDDNDVKFVWPLLKDTLYNYKAFISGNRIELSPIFIPMQKFGSFSNAKQRILMSATTQNDSFFINGLNFSLESIKNPLIDPDAKWSGEKMILLPSLIDDWIDRDAIISNMCRSEERQYGIVSLVPGFEKASDYLAFGAKVAKKETLEILLTELREKKYNDPIIIVNRYDGIDLPDDTCRILILDSKPYFDSLNDKYEESCRKSSDEINIKIAQKVEQGLGRSVRGERDYSIIMIVGDDLTKFIKSPLTTKYFTKQTQQQIAIGFLVASLAKEDLSENDNRLSVIKTLIKQVLSRDIGWKEFYRTEMEKIEPEISNINFLSIMEMYHKAAEQYYKKNSEKACEMVQLIIDEHNDEAMERAWFIQLMAHFMYPMSKVRANALQKSAFNINQSLLMPEDGVVYTKIEYINENRAKRIKKWLEQFANYEEMMISVNGTMSDLSFGIESEKFESAIKEVGELLGFISQRPDKEFKKGPDNLWCGVDNKYFLIECKNEVEDTRKEITKYEAGQMNTHSGWFEEMYGDAIVNRFLIIPTRRLSYAATLTHEVKIIRKGKLRELKANILSYIKEFKLYSIKEISSEKIQEFLDHNKLSLESLTKIYCEDIVH